ncbi:MAG: hypothetical protein JKY95_19760 [Planctomycetaceae bacterium]|nr:hypothetical protein [Planctomycetaceae bacterium]
MKQFIVFGFDYYYPKGGLDDICGDFDTIEEAKQCADNKEVCHCGASVYVIDRDSWQEVYSRGGL